MGLRRRFLTGMMSGVGSVVIKTLFNILLIPLLIGALGAEMYGFYVLLIGLIELSLLMDFGLMPSMVNVLGAYRSTSQGQKAQEILYMGHVLYAGLALVSFAIGYLAMPWIPHLFHFPTALEDMARLSLVLIFIEGALTLYTGYFRAVLLAHCMNHWTNVGDMIFNLAGNAIGVVLLLNGFSLPALLIARLVATVMRSLILMAQTLKVEPEVFRLKPLFRWETLKELFGQGFHALMIQISVIISHKIDSFVIALFLPLTAVSIFEIVFRLLGLSTQVILKMGEGVFPMFSRMVAMAQRENARQFFLRVSCLNSFAISLMLLLIVMFYSELFQFLSANKIPMMPTIPILMVGIPCIWSGALQIPAMHFLFSSGRQQYLTVSSLMTALINLVLSLILIHPFGLTGVALGTLIPQLIQHQGFLIRAACRDLDISFTQYVNAVHVRNGIPLLIAFLFTLLLRPIAAIGPYPLLSIGIVAFAVVILSSSVWIALTTTRDEKAIILAKIRPLLKEKVSAKTKVSSR